MMAAEAVAAAGGKGARVAWAASYAAMASAAQIIAGAAQAACIVGGAGAILAEAAAWMTAATGRARRAEAAWSAAHKRMANLVREIVPDPQML